MQSNESSGRAAANRVPECGHLSMDADSKLSTMEYAHGIMDIEPKKLAEGRGAH